MKTSKVVFLVFLSILSICPFNIQLVKSQSSGTIYIRSDGTVEGTDKIQRYRNVYTFLGNINGSIFVEKDNVVVDGAGYTVQGNGTGRGLDLSNGSGQDPSFTPCSNVTIKNLRIVNFGNGIYTNGKNNTFYGNYVADCDGEGIWIIGGSGNTIMYNTIEDNVNGISICYSGGNNVITKNNMINNRVRSNNVVIVWLSQQPTVDRNYWSDYNGIDEDGDGIGDTPYLFINTDYARYLDYHPLIKPVNISDVEIPPIPEGPDTTSPTISIYSPINNKTYTVNNVSLTFTVSEPASWLGYSLDGRTNITIAGNTTLSELPKGSHSLIVYAKDTAGNTGASETIYFTIEIPLPDVAFPPDPMGIPLVIALIAAGGVTFLIYFVKVKKTHGKVEKPMPEVET